MHVISELLLVQKGYSHNPNADFGLTIHLDIWRTKIDLRLYFSALKWHMCLKTFLVVYTDLSTVQVNNLAVVGLAMINKYSHASLLWCLHHLNLCGVFA